MNLLERDDFHAFLTGCLRTEQTDSGLLLHRHTARQTAYYQKTNEAWAIRSRCPTGIQLNLRSDTRRRQQQLFHKAVPPTQRSRRAKRLRRAYARFLSLLSPK